MCLIYFFLFLYQKSSGESRNRNSAYYAGAMLPRNISASSQGTVSGLKTGNTGALSERVDRMRMNKITDTKGDNDDGQNIGSTPPDSTLSIKGNAGDDAYHDTAWWSFSTDISSTDQYHSGIIFFIVENPGVVSPIAPDLLLSNALSV